MPAKNNPEPSIVGKTLVITRVFNAPRQLVFKAWIEPKQLEQWWGPAGFTAPRCEADGRAGGAIRIDMRGPDGTVYPMSGVFREVLEPERLVFESSALDKVGKPLFVVQTTVTFAENAGKTQLKMIAKVLSATGEAGRYVAGMDAGWNQSLDRFGCFMEKYAGAASVVEPGSDREIAVSRIFDAPRELVWDAWTDPEKIVRWWGPRGFTTAVEVMDVRPGGSWRLTMHGPDGSDYPNASTFQEVVKPHRIVYTLGGSIKGGPAVQLVATWTFEDLGARQTRLTVRMVFPTAAAREEVVRAYGALEGAKQTLARLDELLRSGP